MCPTIVNLILCFVTRWWKFASEVSTKMIIHLMYSVDFNNVSVKSIVIVSKRKGIELC